MNWLRLSSYFQYQKDAHRIMYAINITERFHRQPRAITQSKGALIKLLFLLQENIYTKWIKPVHNKNQTLGTVINYI
jgi:transposase-like protein